MNAAHEGHDEDLSEGRVSDDHFTARKLPPLAGRWIWMILAMAGVTVLVAALAVVSWKTLSLVGGALVSVASAHDAVPTAAKPQGWSYPFSCCSGYDCREVAEGAVLERPEGYVINGTGEVVGYRDARLRNSPDGRVHWCSEGGRDDSKTICLFVPPRGY